jgi:hypothetical protein
MRIAEQIADPPTSKLSLSFIIQYLLQNVAFAFRFSYKPVPSSALFFKAKKKLIIIHLFKSLEQQFWSFFVIRDNLL